MKFFSNTRAKRNTAFVALLVWLFALASGVANACLLEARGTRSHVAIAESPAPTHAPAESAGHAGVVAGHDDDSDTSKAPCLKVCDDGSHSVPTQYSGVDQTDPGMAPVVAVLWRATTPVILASRRMEDLQPPAPGQPFRVRYSRLAL
jgi:hypothetical protein